MSYFLVAVVAPGGGLVLDVNYIHPTHCSA